MDNSVWPSWLKWIFSLAVLKWSGRDWRREVVVSVPDDSWVSSVLCSARALMSLSCGCGVGLIMCIRVDGNTFFILIGIDGIVVKDLSKISLFFDEPGFRLVKSAYPKCRMTLFIEGWVCSWLSNRLSNVVQSNPGKGSIDVLGNSCLLSVGRCKQLESPIIIVCVFGTILNCLY